MCVCVCVFIKMACASAFSPHRLKALKLTVCIALSFSMSGHVHICTASLCFLKTPNGLQTETSDCCKYASETMQTLCFRTFLKKVTRFGKVYTCFSVTICLSRWTKFGLDEDPAISTTADDTLATFWQIAILFIPQIIE